MGFWSYIGLASKKDIENVNIQIDEIKNLINMSISKNEDIKRENDEQNQSVRNSFNEIEDKMSEMNTEVKKALDKVERSSNSKHKKVVEMLNETSNINVKYYEENKNQIADLGNSLKPIYLDITDMKKVNDEKNVEHSNSLNKLIKEFKEHKKNVSALNKDLSIIQEMIKVVWVNDIVDTLESKIPDKSKK